MRRIVVSVVMASLVMASCSSSRTGPSELARTLGARFDPGRITFAAALVPFSACDAVLDYFKAEALARVGPYGLDGGGWYWPFFGFREAVGDAADAPSGGNDSGVTHSTSNVQVAGVDEPDIVKTDGTRIISVVEGVLRYVDLSGVEPTVVGTLRMADGWGHRLLVSGDRIFVISAGEVRAGDVVGDDRIGMPYPWGRTQTRIVEVDASDPSRLRVARTLSIDGGYVSARAVGDTARVVVSSYPDGLGFVYPSSQAGEDAALEANRRVIAESTIEQWLPTFTLTDASGATIAEGLAVPCQRMHRPVEFSGFSTLSVVTLDLAGTLVGGTGTGVIASGETVYASTESLYVATTVWVPSDAPDRPGMGDFAERYSTSIHRFAIDGSGVAEYRASGSVSGHLLNQFSLDEHEGRLRVAITDGPPWGFAASSESRIIVLEERDGVLTEVGSVGDMGRGERIYSVRFIGDTAYVVTFRQVDPFYVVDLSNPAAPRVAGELKIEGYSAYLHPIAEHLILGVGQDADAQGVTRGTKATLFDVSDPANPRDVATWHAGGAWSDVEWDHLAFLAWAPAQIVVLPVMSWSEGFAGAVVLSTADGLSELGRISHQREVEPTGSDCVEIEPDVWTERGVIVQLCGEDDLGGYPGRGCEPIPVEDWPEWSGEGELPVVTTAGDRIEVCWPDSWMYETPILRSLVVGDTLWTLSSGGLRGNAIDDLSLRHSLAFGG